MNNVTNSTSFRVVWRYETSDRSFKVHQEQPAGSRRWVTIDAFMNLPTALQCYPSATTDDADSLVRSGNVVLERQRLIETRPHGFERQNDGRDECHRCSKPRDWQAHGGAQ